MSTQRKHGGKRGRYVDARAIVGDLQQLQSPVLDGNLDRGGAGIDRVLNQLFERVDGCDNDLAGGDFVYDVLVEGLHAVR